MQKCAGLQPSKTQLFRFFGKPLKMRENINKWHQDNWNVKIHSFWKQNMQTCEISKSCHFSQVLGHRNLHFFFIYFFFFFQFWKAFENEWIHQYLTSGQLKYKISLIWRQNMQKDIFSKNCHFSQVLGHRKLHVFFFVFFFFCFFFFFSFLESLWKWMNTSILDIRTAEM